jgi:hypothetical protein
MAEMWICGDCRSTNAAKDKRCYRCGVPRATSEMTEATAGAALATAPDARTVLAAATRIGARYRTTWPLAILTGAAILASAAIDIVQTRYSLSLLLPDGSYALDVANSETVITLGTAYLVCFILSGLGWSLWIALVVGNVPALTARWPKRTQLGAFFALWIPILNLKRPYSIVKEVTTILSNAAFGPALLVIAWWISWLLFQYGSLLVIILRGLSGDDKTVGGLMTSGTWGGLVFEIVAAILAACVLLVVEYHQQLALQRRSQVVLGAESAAV